MRKLGWRTPVPWQKVANSLGRMIGQASEDVGEPGLRIDVVKLRDLDQRVASRADVDELGAFLEKNGMILRDPPGEYYGSNYYAVCFPGPDGMKLEGMVWARPVENRKPRERGRRS